MQRRRDALRHVRAHDGAHRVRRDALQDALLQGHGHAERALARARGAAAEARGRTAETSAFYARGARRAAAPSDALT